MEQPQPGQPVAMQVSSDEVLGILQQRAQEDPLVREILRSSAYEAILQRRARENTEMTVPELEEVQEAD